MNRLLPYRYKYIGIACLALATVLIAVYLYRGLRISVPVIAIFSSFIETRFFTTFTTNFTEEIIFIFYLAGFSLVVLSYEKHEKRFFRLVRLRAIYRAVIYYLAWILLNVLFVYGRVFKTILVVTVFMPFVFYLIAFYHLKQKETKRRRLLQIKRLIKKHSSEKIIQMFS